MRETVDTVCAEDFDALANRLAQDLVNSRSARLEGSHLETATRACRYTAARLKTARMERGESSTSPPVADRLRAAVEDAIETLESMDMHIDNPLYERLRAAIEG